MKALAPPVTIAAMPSTTTISIRLKPRRELFVLVAEVIAGVFLSVRAFRKDLRLQRILLTGEAVAVRVVPWIDRHALEGLVPAARNRRGRRFRDQRLEPLLGGREIASQHLISEEVRVDRFEI